MTKMMIAFATIAASMLMATTAQARPCKEGSVAAFQVDNGNDRYRTEYRTCTNGTYYPVVRTKGVRCVEGNVSMFTEDNGQGNDRYVTVARTCVNGSYYPKAGPVKIIQCKEGAKALFYEDDGYTDRQRQVWKTCINGKYVK